MKVIVLVAVMVAFGWGNAPQIIAQDISDLAGVVAKTNLAKSDNLTISSKETTEVVKRTIYVSMKNVKKGFFDSTQSLFIQYLMKRLNESTVITLDKAAMKKQFGDDAVDEIADHFSSVKHFIVDTAKCYHNGGYLVHYGDASFHLFTEPQMKHIYLTYIDGDYYYSSVKKKLNSMFNKKKLSEKDEKELVHIAFWVFGRGHQDSPLLNHDALAFEDDKLYLTFGPLTYELGLTIKEKYLPKERRLRQTISIQEAYVKVIETK